MAFGDRSQLTDKESNVPKPQKSTSLLTRSTWISTLRMGPIPWRFLHLGILLWSAGIGLQLSLDDPRLRYVPYVVGHLTSVAGMLLIVLAKPKRPWVAIGLGLVARLWALNLGPAFSEDVFRHLYEGRLMLQEGWLAPYQVAPAEAPPDLRDQGWLRINHPELATVYPLGTQLLAAASAWVSQFGLTNLFCFKALLVAFELVAWRWLHGRSAHLGLLWGLNPLLIQEVSRDGHVDGVVSSALLLALTGGPGLRWVGLSLSSLTKLIGLIAMPIFLLESKRRLHTVAGLLALGLVLALPFALSWQPDSGLAAYTTRWRAGDGVFAGVHALGGWLLGGAWRFIPALSITLTQDQVARWILLLGFGATSWFVLRSKRPPPHKAVTLVVLVLLCGPTLHPWYTLWPLALAVGSASPLLPVVVWLTASGVFLHGATHHELITGYWQDHPTSRLFLHGAAWVIWIATKHAPPLDR